MKKIAKWFAIISITLLTIVSGFIGLSLANGNYNIKLGACLALACFVIFSVSICVWRLTNKCFYCGRLVDFNKKFCPHCGKEWKK